MFNTFRTLQPIGKRILAVRCMFHAVAPALWKMQSCAESSDSIDQSYVEYYSDYSVHISSLPLGAKDKYSRQEQSKNYDTNEKNSPVSLSRPSFSCTHDGASLTAKTWPGKAAKMTLCLK